MEVTFAVILWAVRIAFLVLLYLFLIRSFRALQRALADERTAVAALAGVAGVPEESCRWTVIGPRFAKSDFGPDTATEVMTSWLAVAAVMVSI